MKRTLCAAQSDPNMEVSVCVTGMHLLPLFGNTVGEIESSGLRICARIPVVLDGSTGAVMARAIGHELISMVEVLESERPDIVIVLGDRGEMLAGALAAIHLNIPIVHIHGGECSGTVDEPVRHAISKLSHIHMVSTVGARQRLIRMGERPERIFVTGAPGLDGIEELARRPREELSKSAAFDPQHPIALVMFHPVLQESDIAGMQMTEVMEAVLGARLQALCLTPNGDAGGRSIRSVLEGLACHPSLRIVDHLAREEYLSWLASVDVMIGNSSSGIIEAATLGCPVVNVGSRQSGRERSENVVDVQISRAKIVQAIEKELSLGRRKFRNVYGDGQAGERIVKLLSTLAFDRTILNKTNAY